MCNTGLLILIIKKVILNGIGNVEWSVLEQYCLNRKKVKCMRIQLLILWKYSMINKACFTVSATGASLNPSTGVEYKCISLLPGNLRKDGINLRQIFKKSEYGEFIVNSFYSVWYWYVRLLIRRICRQQWQSWYNRLWYTERQTIISSIIPSLRQDVANDNT